jgi:epoxyqueuosine reductase
MDSSNELKDFCRSSGADLVGIADLAPFQQGWLTLPSDLLLPYTCAISVAVRLDDTIMDAIASHPTVDYAEHYRAANADLDRLTAEISVWIVSRGYRAEAVPASKIMEAENLLGAVSHKAIARMAGIGWQGKSMLIVSSEFGPRIRLATVLTDACPVKAIRNVTAVDRYASREEALIFDRCVQRTHENSLLPGIGARICGVCVKVCPHGKPCQPAGCPAGFLT